MESNRPRLVLIPQHFGSLIFDRSVSRYFPFDHESTNLLKRCHQNSVGHVIRQTNDVNERLAVERFINSFIDRGFFNLYGKLDATILEIDTPMNHLVGPLATHVEIIGACNLTCSHCFAGQLPRNHAPLTLNELGDLFRQLASLGSFRLGLTGGEPFLRKDIFDILDAATTHGLHPCLTTNATLLTERMAIELGKRQLVWLNVSLDGPTAETNDVIRGKGTFDRVMSQIQMLRQHARFTLAFTLMKTNVHVVTECAELAHQVGAHTAVFRPMYPAGIGLHHLDMMPTYQEYVGAMAELESVQLPGHDVAGQDVFSPKSRAETEANIHRKPTCGAGQHVCSVSVQGDVNPCSFLGAEFNSGNIRERPFREIWNDSQIMAAMRRELPEGSFAGGCRARSLVFRGSVDAADPWFDEHQQSGCYHPNDHIYQGRFALPMLNRS